MLGNLTNSQNFSLAGRWLRESIVNTARPALVNTEATMIMVNTICQVPISSAILGKGRW